ncbi:MAG: SufS family cysteine desulfurase [bacterium]|nr:SufS family cysteine desulfurase [bacterium]
MEPLIPKGDFPLLAHERGNESLVYLDATAQKPAVVLGAMDRFYREQYAPVGRGIYALTEQATRRFAEARAAAASFLGAADPSEIVFTKSATEGINLVALGWARHNLRKGDAILLTEMEHHSNLVPWQMLAEASGLELRFARITEQGTLDLDDFKRKVPGAKLVAVAHVSNVLGTVNPVAELATLAHEGAAKILVDGAQAAPRLPVDVRSLGADWYVCSGHKLYGPTGIGVLWTRTAMYGSMQPVSGGGGAVTDVSFEKATFADPPAKFEPGSPPVAEAVGLAAAIGYLKKAGMEAIAGHEQALNAYALERLGKIAGLRVLGPLDPPARAGLISFVIDGVHPHDLATFLDQENVAVRSGHHCAQPLHARLGVPASVRASWGVYTGTADVDRLTEGIRKAIKTLV